MDRAKGDVRYEDGARFTMSSNEQSPDEIRENIGRTRNEMDATLDEIDRRLSLSYWTDEILGKFRANPEARREAMASLGSAGRTAMDQLRRHPWPALLIGGGIAWWISQSGRSEAPGIARGSLVDAQTGEPYPGREEEAYGSEIGTGARLQHKAKALARRSGDRAAEVASGITHSAQSAMHQLGAKAKSGLSTAGRAVGSSARSSAQVAGRQVRSGATYGGQRLMAGGRQASSMAMDAMHQSPWATGVACLGLGLLAGALLPSTRRENELMGESSDRLREMAAETMHKGQEIASASLAAAKQEAQRQDLTAEGLKRQAGQAVQKGSEKLQEQGLGVGQLKEKAAHVVEAAVGEARRKADQEGLSPRSQQPR